MAHLAGGNVLDNCRIASDVEFRFQDERAFSAMDSRCDVREVSVNRGNHRIGCVLLVQFKNVLSLSDTFRASLGLGLERLAGAVCLIGGGLAHRRSAGFVCSCADEESTWRELFERALEGVRGLGTNTILTYLEPGAQTRAAEAAALGAIKVGEETWSGLTLPRVSSPVGAWDAAPRKVRQTWAHDFREIEALGLVQTVEPLTGARLVEAAPLFSSVSERNGVRQPPALSKMFLGSLQSRPGEPVLLLTRGPDGDLLATTACRFYRNIVDVHAVGVVPHHAHRRSVYHAATFAGPVGLAISRSSTFVQFGFGHPEPKLRRGCRVVQLVSLAAS